MTNVASAARTARRHRLARPVGEAGGASPARGVPESVARKYPILAVAAPAAAPMMAPLPRSGGSASRRAGEPAGPRHTAAG
jgi:hypothetical protein